MTNKVKDEDIKKVAGGKEYKAMYNGVEITFSLTLPGHIRCPQCGAGWGYLYHCPRNMNQFDYDIGYCSKCGHVW